MTAFGLVLVALCSYRLTRLIVLDDFPPAEWLRAKIPDKGWGGVVHCGFCASVWISVPVWAAWRFGGTLVHDLVTLGAIMGAAALLFSWEGET